MMQDVFYVMFGMWKTSAKKLFLWIGGFLPSELLKVMSDAIYILDKKIHVILLYAL